MFRRPFARPTRRPTAERTSAAAVPGGTVWPPCPQVVRDQGRAQRPHGRHCRQRGLDLAPRLGGRSHTAAPCKGRGPPAGSGCAFAIPEPGSGAPAGLAPGNGGASMCPPSPSATRSSAGASAPHSSQSSSPGSSSALPAATSSRIRSPRTATGELGPSRHSAATPASTGTSRTSKRRPVTSRSGSPGTVRHPSSFSYQCRCRSFGSSGRRGSVTVPGGGLCEPCQEQPPKRAGSYAGWSNECAGYGKRGRSGVRRGARLFARSGGNRCERHGVSVRTGKTIPSGRGRHAEKGVSRSPSAYSW